jgi:L-rhamnose mutarotase
MPRYRFVSQVDPKHLVVYRERHAAVWSEMLRALRDAGWRNYSLHLGDDELLVGYFEADDAAAAQAAMDATAVNARWQAEMAELFEGDGAPDAGFRYLPEVFNLDDQLARAESSDQD